ncbi:MAG TPA: Crp/Fnr family transcriptional regulator [Sphingomonas sp.]|jgi:hypothetical protein|uniref:Crp/Fnr family transcriptional regulator n=1 Tax=Sphingomonas sp. TaxID=28214 RepID=UPI002ED89124
MPQPSQSFTRNALLSRMAPDDFALLQPHLERVELQVHDELMPPDADIAHVYFPESIMCSMVSTQEGDDKVEVGLVGYEGLTGIPVILRAGRSPVMGNVQIGGGTALRIPAADILAACNRSETLMTTLLRFVQATIVQAAQTSASNANYALPERLARWLLMCHDRVEGDDVPLTHEFMAIMLAVRRSGVTVTLHTLEGTGAIRSTRGLVTIRDRQRLEEIAGECYGAPESEYRRLLGPFGRSPAH